MGYRRRIEVRIATSMLALLLVLVSAPNHSDLEAAGPPVETPPETPYRLALPGYRFQFPRDHASHPDYQLEWWYYSGHLASEAGGARRFGYELTFFRVGLDPARARSRSAWAPHTIYFAHAALTDETRTGFRFAESAERPALGLAGADTSRYRVWIEDWSAALDPDGRRHRLHAAADDFALDLVLDPLKPPAIHGHDGVSQKSAALGRATHYYSLTRMASLGGVRAGRDSLTVQGESWMDHEFGTRSMAPGQQGWDWFALQLDDGRELMLYRLRLTNGGIEPMSSGTLVQRDGATRFLSRTDYSVEVTGTWRSPRTGATYPAGWRIQVPSEGLDLTLVPTVADQELVTGGEPVVAYWEGSVEVRGKSGPRILRGQGYAELTGYAGRVPGS